MMLRNLFGARALLAFALVGVLLAVRAPRFAQAQASGPHYVVQQGDTLYGIALRFGLTVEALLATNPGISPEALGVGQVLVIPGYETLSGTLQTHTALAGESMASLALRFGLKAETLLKLNRVVNPDRLYVNQPIIVVDSADAGPAIANGTTYLVRPAGGLLTLAAAHGQSPWGLAAANRLAHPASVAPGATIVVPGGERPALGLPYPLLEVQLAPFPPTQGLAVSVKVVSAEPVPLRGTLGEAALSFHTEPDLPATNYALVGIHRLTAPDLYDLQISTTDQSGPVVAWQQPVPVRRGDYGVDLPLTVDPATLDPDVSSAETAQVRALVTPATADRLWSGPFALPSVGVVRSAFGSLRSYNGGPYDSFHGGVDFSGASDRPITAPAAGIVVFAGPLIVRGHSTIIDHGWGVYTGYWHQSEIRVAAGDRVETGQLIGYNGATGRVTGPHLHWEVWVGGYQVDPLQWTEVSFP